MTSSSKVFRGDDDSLVDALVAACAEHKAEDKALLPGFGRELQPYFAEGEFVPLPSSKSSTKQGKSPQRSGPRPASARTDNKGSKSPSPTTKKFQATGDSSRASAIPIPSSRNESRSAGHRKLCSSPPACPGIFSSPLPSEVPRPSFELIRCANSPVSSRPTSGHYANVSPCVAPFYSVHTSISVKAA